MKAMLGIYHESILPTLKNMDVLNNFLMHLSNLRKFIALDSVLDL
jgi:hypothetical protein